MCSQQSVRGFVVCYDVPWQRLIGYIFMYCCCCCCYLRQVFSSFSIPKEIPRTKKCKLPTALGYKLKRTVQVFVVIISHKTLGVQITPAKFQIRSVLILKGFSVYVYETLSLGVVLLTKQKNIFLLWSPSIVIKNMTEIFPKFDSRTLPRLVSEYVI